jgi:hypothetical protein
MLGELKFSLKNHWPGIFCNILCALMYSPEFSVNFRSSRNSFNSTKIIASIKIKRKQIKLPLPPFRARPKFLPLLPLPRPARLLPLSGRLPSSLARLKKSVLRPSFSPFADRWDQRSHPSAPRPTSRRPTPTAIAAHVAAKSGALPHPSSHPTTWTRPPPRPPPFPPLTPQETAPV